ncbi:CAP domain-containing protein [Streptomyces sp. P1-3]|uniref:CAP domain-containing protein n=1 Tax=Streptomyces sp. P1-3 TaxID=3421658 RepID=UPI003D363F8D
MHPHDDDQTLFLPPVTEGAAPSEGRGNRSRTTGGGRRGRRGRGGRRPGAVAAGALVVAALCVAGTVALGGSSGDEEPSAASVRGTDGTAPAPQAPSSAPSASASASPSKKPRASVSAAAKPSARPSAPRRTRGGSHPGGTSGGTSNTTGSRPQQSTPAPRATPHSGPATGPAARYAQRVLVLVNAERAKAGCTPLRLDSRVQAAAQAHADDMAARNYYEHNSPEGEDAGSRMRKAGYPAGMWAENIHKGPKDPETAMRDWMNSPGHRDNILNCALKDFGAGVNPSANGPWWVQNFGTGN